MNDEPTTTTTTPVAVVTPPVVEPKAKAKAKVPAKEPKAEKAAPKEKKEEPKAKAPKLPKLKAGQILLDTEELGEGIRLARTVVNESSNIASLSNIRLDCDGKKLELTGTCGFPDFVRVKVPLVEGKAKFTCGVLSSHLLSAIAELSDAHTILRFDKEFIEIGGRAEIKLVATPAKDMPDCKAVGTKVLAEGEIRDANKFMEAVMPFMSEDESRFVLNGFFVEFAKNVVVATDGRRLAYVGMKNGTAEISVGVKDRQELKDGLIVSSKTADLLKWLADVKFKVHERIESISGQRLIHFYTKEVDVITPLIDGTYPNWAQVLPDEKEYHFQTVGSEDVSRLLRTTEVIQEKDTDFTVLKMTADRLTLSSRTAAGEADRLSLPITKGHPVTITVRSEYLSSAVKAAGSDMVRLGIKDETSPILVTSPDKWFQSVIMPVRAQQ